MISLTFYVYKFIGSIDTDFRPQLSHLSESLFTVVGWDPPGYGNTTRPPNRDFSGGRDMFYRDARLAQALMKARNCNYCVNECWC